jgi:molybdate transport repressor ModE-like protein
LGQPTSTTLHTRSSIDFQNTAYYGCHYREESILQLTLKQLEVFHAIVVAGSISNATRSLGLSQPTVSQQLAKLEESLGAQLVQRGRSGSIKLTAAGEYWLKVARNVLETLDEATQTHRAAVDEKRLALRFGTTPSLRGRFTEVAAQTALDLGCFSRFDFAWALTSHEVVEMINTRSIHIGVVSAASVEGQKSSLYVEHLCRDRIVWIVPAEIPDEVIAQSLAMRAAPPERYSALTRYADVTSFVPWRDRTENWYRNALPFAAPFFGCMTHHAAVDFAAAGLATCHSPMSLLPNLPEQVRSRIKMFDLDEIMREVVLVMPKHLVSLKPFMMFRERIGDYIRSTYGDHVAPQDVRPIPWREPPNVRAAE